MNARRWLVEWAEPKCVERRFAHRRSNEKRKKKCNEAADAASGPNGRLTRKFARVVER